MTGSKGQRPAIERNGNLTASIHETGGMQLLAHDREVFPDQPISR